MLLTLCPVEDAGVVVVVVVLIIVRSSSPSDADGAAAAAAAAVDDAADANDRSDGTAPVTQMLTDCVAVAVDGVGVRVCVIDDTKVAH